MRTPTLDRFWSKVSRCGDDECWEWKAKRDKDGYGRFWDGTFTPSGNGRMVGAHQFSLSIATGEERGDRWVLHRCDNPPCVNPKHLYFGTVVDNSRDMISRGRGGKKPHDPAFCGERIGGSRLTTEQVIEIKSAGSDVQNTQLAAVYGVRPTTISQIRRGGSWKHIQATGSPAKRTGAHNKRISEALRGNKNALGWKHTEESRAKIVASWRRRKSDGCREIHS